jgi:hypothetical protein
MSARFKKWLPFGLCCVPGLVIATVVGASVLLGGATFGVGLGGPRGIGILALAILACPLSMGLMMWRGNRGGSSGTMNSMPCCAPGEGTTATVAQPEADSLSERLARLVVRREALERELAQQGQS